MTAATSAELATQLQCRASAIRVVHVIVGLNLGGAELMLARLVEASHRPREFEHVVVSLTTVGPIGSRLRVAGIDVYELGISYSASAVISFFRLRSLLRSLRPTVVQTWMYHSDLLGGLAARSMRIRNVVWGIRTTYIQYEGPRFTRFLAHACSWLSRTVPHNIVCAAEASRRAHVAMGYDASKMVVIPNGFDVARLARSIEARTVRRAELGFTDDATILIGAVGRFSPVKDFRNFIEGCRIVANRLSTARFVLIGRGLTWDNHTLTSWLDGNELTERFSLLGERQDIPEYLAALDIFCLSSKSEGFPNVVGEAMGVGVPCVVTDVGDAAFLVADTGRVVAKEDANALGAALVEVADLEPARRHEMGARARARIQTTFSLEMACREFEALYRKLCSSTAGDS
jgi:glycosyltransferase involved in cell wall biosynthesis